MSQRLPRPAAALIVAVTVMSTTLAVAAPSAAAPPKALPGERLLSPADEAAALVRMTARERAMREPHFHDPSIAVVAYVQRYFAVEEGPDGATDVRAVGMPDPDAGALDVPSIEVAGPASRYDLYISMAIYRNTRVLAYEWRPQAYFEWNGTEGMDQTGNHQEDILAISWPGGLYLYSDIASGRYTDADRSPIDFYRSEVSDTGVGWHFHEYRACGWLCPRNPADYGSLFARIREATYQGRTGNVMMRYVHTKGGSSLSYSVSLGAVSIGVNPNDSNQWSVAAYASFSY